MGGASSLTSLASRVALPLLASFISISTSMLMTEDGRTEAGPGDMQHETDGLLAGDRDGSSRSLLPAR